jgi:hypothetical protein
MKNKDVVKVKIKYIIEVCESHTVEIPISQLSSDEEGLYDFGEIQEIADKLAREKIVTIGRVSSPEIDECEIVSTPDDFEYWH